MSPVCAAHEQASTTMEGTQLGAVMLPHLNERSSFRNRTGTSQQFDTLPPPRARCLRD